MEALHIQPFEEPGALTQNQEVEKGAEQDGAGTKASSPTGSTTEEETDEDSEPEPPPVIRRKVSFADAFGLNLVSVKEFDNVDVTESEVGWSKGRDVTRSAEEFYLSCLFTVPASQEELDQRLHAQMIELESIEILPGTTILRGIIRVLNLCYSKSVYARMSLDHWRSYFDLLAEYVPGSSDRKTDRFTFKYTLVPPFETGGTRIEFCLRYETPEGTFWANNNEMNYVLFCHQKGQTSVAQTDEESSSYRSKRSCLKANRNGDAEEKIRGTISTYILAAEAEAAPKLEKSGRKMTNAAETLLHNEEQKPWVESAKSRRRATRLARVQDYLFKTMQQQLSDSAHVQKVSQHMPAPWGNSGSLPYECQKIRSSESPQVLTYHQIPLLPLDWNNDPPQRCETAHVDDILAGGPKMTLSNASEEKPVNDMWETTDEANGKEASVSDVWQAFLNGPGSKDRSDVPESEWLQTAASVSPSNDREPQIQYSAESREFQELQAGTDTATASHTLAACQPLSDTCEPLSAVVSLNTKDHQLKEACVSSSRDDNTATQAASQRSQTNSVTDTPLDFSLKRAPPVSGGSDSPTECHEQEVWEQECEGIIAPGIGGDEPFTLHTADLVTSSGESETTDMTAVPESHNANAGDMIAEGARRDEGLSSSGEREVTATAHNASDDTLAFRETIGQETKDEARNVCSASRQEVEEEIVISYSENKVSREEEIFRPEKAKDKVESQEAGQNGEDKEIIEILDDQVCQSSNNVLQVSSSGQMEKIFILEACGTHVQKREDLALKEQEESVDLKSEIGEHVSDSNLLGDRNRLSWEGKAMEQKEISPSANFRPIVDTTESKKIFQISHDTPRLGPMDKCNPNPLEVVELRWTHSQQELKSQNDDLSSEISSEDVPAKKNGPKRDTLPGHQPEASGGAEEDLTQEDKSICIGKLETEAMREMMGNAKSPQMESQNAWKEQELSAEDESSPIGEYKKPSIGTKEPIAAVNSAALEAVEPRREQRVIERFGEDLASKIWEEIFAREAQTSSRRTNTADEMRNAVAGAIHRGRRFLFEQETFDSGVFSLTELPTDLNVRLGQAQEQTSATESNECSTNDRSQILLAAQKAPILYKLQTDFNSSPHLSHELTATSAALIGEPLFQSTQALNSPKDQENCSQIKARSATRQETDSQTGDCVFTQRKSSDRSSNMSNKYLGSTEKLKESDALLWWTILYTISHLTRLLICTLLVGGFFVVVFLYDFPAFFAFYLFSVCWWVYSWKRHRVTADNRIAE
ncbi:uncharacterized protein ppp1r3aa [Kryptolebias marmoratus]|uniref:Protein phosphatase 1 regulatory subunit 3A n=1 Tax=Kryptolebias marmoratus TaxID=37003 RepID=A0A3Q3BRA4_KRYMA|nr:uncharacterized protein ppp1r3aa [Kryptolebias marmoratus]